ncbi:gliding motility-associated C-terminal domain-containing protein [Flavobacterium eburneipallidum]|uniref:gliding motility-associated C-terminal domain-containing protein n=1 Tax=Flavobacterium eburneipallidum TaxID=3003263 RepID=UPI002482F018|nr:gliding motility-associated C-terminal domain-containing protein [Flavobacterium eburneipallidum]
MVKKYTFLILVFILLFFSSTKNYGQCAGNDVLNFEVCDISNSSSQAIALFPLLGPNAIPGGTWSDDNLSRGLDVTTGVLNAQIISSSGVYHFTYTVSGGCADTSATITVTIGGYSGVSDFKSTACSDDQNYNLFQVFDTSGGNVSAQSNGSWYNNKTNTPIVGNFVNAELLGLGDTQFTYTIPAIGNCPAVSSTGIVTVFRAPKPGNPSKLLLCDSDDLSVYSNYDLNNLLTSEDAGGTWEDNNGSGQITFLKDHNVDIQYIYNNFGIGNYTFSYTVLPTNPICEKKTSTVRIRIEKLLDFTGATLVVSSDICESQIASASYSVTLTKGPAVIPNGQYYVTYSISGLAAETKTDLVTFNNGVVNFPLDSKYFQQVGDFRVQITNITAFDSEGACNNTINDLFDILHVYPTPVLDGAKLTIAPVCQNKSALVQITDATFLADGTYDIIYNLSGTNTVASQTIRIVSVGGVSSFTIPSNFIVNEGNTVVTITKITNTITSCSNIVNLNGTMLVNPLPNPTNVKIAVNDYCLNEPVSVAVSGLGSLTATTITYQLSGANVATQTLSLVASGGNASFIIPSNLLSNTGTTTISLTNLINDNTTCGVVVSTVSDAFAINAIPSAPVAGSQQNFCQADAAKVGNLTPNGSQYQWFDSETATTPLASSVLLVSKDYYVREVAPTSLCFSIPTKVAVTINPIPAAPITTAQQEFCKIEAATVANLIPNGAQYQWFDSATATTPLANSTLLVSANYYLKTIAPTTLCLSTATVVAVKINEVSAPILNQSDQTFCGINKPKVLDLMQNTTIPNSTVWYDAPVNGNLIDNSTLLQDKIIYYGFDVSPITNCLPKNNFAVTVSLTDCSTTTYDFFIPDGFSPNADGVNDTFKIPEVEFLYPNYTFEIYNRYGNVLFKGNKNKPEWDGRNSASAGFSDAIVPNGVYFYIINFNKDNKSPQQGSLYLNR